MAGGRLQAPRGTFDVLPEEGRRRDELRRACAELVGAAGYGPLETPAIESTELFARGVGEGTDIVQKEMFTFEDAGGRSLSLRPEGTAGVCRAYVQHGMHKLPQPVKLWYWGPFFRYEAPQAGRQRQFTQAGIEAIGSDDPTLDAEAILLLAELLDRAGVREARLRLSSLGRPEARRAYVEELRGYLRAHQDELSGDVRARLDTNPLRAFDAADPGTVAAMREAPKLLDHLPAEDLDHLAEVRALLDRAGLDHDLDPTLVRGLDYYTRTVFEFTSDALGAQSQLGGGGRYDGLIEELGGPATPAVGWAAGIERILLASEEPAAGAELDAYVVVEDPGSAAEAFLLARDLRGAGLRADIEQAGRSVKGQLRHADRLQARFVALVGDGRLRVRDRRLGDERTVGDRAEAVLLLSGRRG